MALNVAILGLFPSSGAVDAGIVLPPQHTVLPFGIDYCYRADSRLFCNKGFVVLL